MNTYLASDADISSISTLPWWLQLTIGVAMLLGAGGMHELDKRMDSDFLEFGAFVVGLAGIFVVTSALV
ncbi:hypothetical protein [Streptomyces sp. WM6378]|uniref:hypothetical protein n=1 Tax=Streptomyces sp. WM6378 TaxID=1415557 RepID=UPI0006B00BEB|nr:hypothetical protein [Streptomyces sp. WM6378]KOU43245.1 hypothetical protein ADK54_18235 [Streptomyces sp. WM6378]